MGADTTAELVQPNSPPVPIPANAGERTIKRLDQLRYAQGPIPTAELRRELQVLMQTYAPMYRNSKDLATGKAEVINTMRKFKDVGVTDRSLVWSTENRHESRGAQAHEDYPDRNDVEWMKHTVSWVSGTEIETGGVTLDSRPVCDQPMDDEMHHVPPA